MLHRKPLTEKQQKVYAYIVQHIRNHGYPPTIREMQAYFKYHSSNSIATYLDSLEENGYITRAGMKHGQKARTIRLVDDMIGTYSIDTKMLARALIKLRDKGHHIHHNEAVELLKMLEIRLI